MTLKISELQEKQEKQGQEPCFSYVRQQDDNLISIVIPFLNEQCSIQNNIHKWLQWQEDYKLEIIFVDGGSLDHGPDTLTSAGFRVLVSPPGRAQQMNKGAAYASGRLICFMHIDTFALSFSQFYSQLNQVKTQLGWGFFTLLLDREGVTDLNPVKRVYNHTTLNLVQTLIALRSTLSQISTGDQCQFFTRAFFLQLNGFKNQPLFEDIDISCRAKSVVKPLVMKSKVVTSSRRWLKVGVWRTIWHMWRLRFRYWQGVSAAVLAKEYAQIR